jgi:hypothetical protein
VINIAGMNFLQITVNPGYLHLGSIALPFNLLVKINTVTHSVEFHTISPDTLLLTVDSTGA